MSEFVEVQGLRGVMVKLGMGQPIARSFVAGTVAAGLLFALKQPAAAFREDGSMKPFKYLSAEPDATTTHFLLPVAGIAAAAYLFT